MNLMHLIFLTMREGAGLVKHNPSVMWKYNRAPGALELLATLAAPGLRAFGYRTSENFNDNSGIAMVTTCLTCGALYYFVIPTLVEIIL